MYPSDFDRKKLEEYFYRAKITKTIPYKKLLQEAGVTKDSGFTNAGILFFAKNPQHFISHSVFSCVLFKDKEGSE